MPHDEKITLAMILIFTVFLAVMAVSFLLLINRYRVILGRRQREALNNLIIGQDKERERLSRDLHDQMGPHLSAIRAIVSSLKPENTEMQEVLNEVKEELFNASQEVRNISHDLMSASLRRYGLTEAVKKLIERNKRDGTELEFSSDTDGSELNDRQISHIYSIVRELLQNTFKHADARHIWILFSSDKEKRRFTLGYEDDGKGFQSEEKDAGIGLSNIRTRVMLMDGELELETKGKFALRMKINY